jgi:hypothetical protein
MDKWRDSVGDSFEHYIHLSLLTVSVEFSILEEKKVDLRLLL